MASKTTPEREAKLYRDLSQRFNEIGIPGDAFDVEKTNADEKLHSCLTAFFDERAAMVWNSTTGELNFVGKEKC